jgi:aspartate/methionine/tyrosine aminotransferase
MDAMRSFQVMDLLDRAQRLEAAGRDVIHMEVGEPDFTSAEPILAAGEAAIRAGATRYTSALGLPALREAIAAYYGRWHGVALAPERIVVTAGATGALVMLAALLLEEGDGLLMADPCYPCNRQLPLLVGAEAQLVPTGPEAAYQLDAAAIAGARRPNTRGVLLASPANPTGSVLGRDALAALLEEVGAAGMFTIVDEIYQGLDYPSGLGALPADARHGRADPARCSTVLQLGADPGRPLYVVNSFSKYFGMTGWRIGWLVAPEAAVPQLEKLAQNFWIAPSTPGQHAAVAALSDEAIAVHEARRRAFCERRNRLVAGLRDLGLGVPRVPEGAFYVYAYLGDLPVDAFGFCERLLDEAGVAATPGTDFGAHRAERHVRFAYTADLARIDEALARLGAFVGSFAA